MGIRAKIMWMVIGLTVVAVGQFALIWRFSANLGEDLTASADAHTAEALRTDSGDPVFRIERTSFTTGARPVDYETLQYRGDAVTFETRLRRAPAGPK